jgi:hypothetical protein
MPVDFVAVRTRVNAIGAEAREREESLAQRRTRARDALDKHAVDLHGLAARLEEARAADAHLRCAVPGDEGLTSRHEAPTSAPRVVLIAADGSQVTPNRHAAVPFGIVNAAAVVMRPGSGAAPERHVASELLFGDDAEDEGGLLTEEAIALRRDLKERALLEEVSKDVAGPALALTDGPLELWGAKGGDAHAYRHALDAYVGMLSRLQSRGVITAGYVDKPGADLVVRLLEIAEASAQELKTVRAFRPLRGVTDRWLFGAGDRLSPLLGAGERSAIFGLQSGSEKNFRGDLALHFFYLNVGTARHPHPVRVELPRWVAADAQKVAMLHAALLDQCRIMGVKPYPYVLHRAHEEALVKRDEAAQIEQLLANEMRRQGVEVEEMSNKQSAKDLPGRTAHAGTRF